MKNIPHYLILIVAVYLFLTLPQTALDHWLNKKVDKLTDVNAWYLTETGSDHMPVDVYFNENNNGVDVTYETTKIENGLFFEIEAHYKGLTANKNHEALYIQTGNGESIQQIIKDYFEQNPYAIVSEEDIDYLLQENMDTEYMNYSIDVVSREGYTSVIVRNYCNYCGSEDDEPVISDYIYYESDGGK